MEYPLKLEEKMNKQNNDYFFDCHCHTMTLGHVNITSFLQNLLQNRDWELLLGLVGTTAQSSEKKVTSHIKNIFNLLTLMQNDLLDIFKIMEDDLRGKFGGANFTKDNCFKMNKQVYKKLVITPLLMDFKSLPGATGNNYYHQPQKEIITIINEYAFAIKQYYKDRPDGLLYILPFLGINPTAYTMKELTSIIEDSFSSYTVKKMNKSILGSKMLTKIAGDISPKNIFAGIKLYPPMGFNPWPEDKLEREKVEFLYSYAQAASIPITTHCNDGGFITVNYKQATINTKPETWHEVLRRYPKLRINFAHAGVSITSNITSIFKNKERSWTDQIFDLIDSYENVYTDLSYNGISPKFYDKFSRTLDNLEKSGRQKYRDRVLFGTDFMINLLGIKSYQDYFSYFNNSDWDMNLKHRISSINPRRFLNYI